MTSLQIGNEEFLLGYELGTTENFYQLDESFGGGGFFTPTPEACETECFVRDSIFYYCGGWTFIPNQRGTIRNCWTEILARSLGHIIILVHRP
jgi:hypothetical protein